MADAPNPTLLTPSYVPLHQKNKHWEDPCELSILHEGPDFIRIYGINYNGISDSSGLKFDKALEVVKDAKACIFAYNETHADQMNVLNNMTLQKSIHRMFNPKQKEHCRLVSSCSLTPGIKYTNAVGNMMGLTGPLTGRYKSPITDKYGCWCRFVLLGKDNREIIVLTAYNVPQITPAGDDTLYAQQISLYLIDTKVDPHPRKLFIQDLLK